MGEVVKEEETTKKLYNAATKGDVITLQQLLQQDPYLLEATLFASSRNLLHIATTQGEADIVEEVLKINPRLARSLDSQQSSPLHIAAAEGNFEIASKLVSRGHDMCWWRDCRGMNPVHIAAMNGHVEILEHLIKVEPLSAWEKVDRGQSVMHLCVKHGQVRALKVLVEKLGEIVYAEDDDGDTILHLAARFKQIEIIRYLVGSTKLEVRRRNSKGKTAQEVVEESPHPTSSDIQIILKQATPFFPNEVNLHPGANDAIMVVVALIATVAFQAVVSPPGGVWQEDSSTHKAGEAVMASTRPKIYKYFVYINTIAFVASIIVMFMLIPRNRFLNPLSLNIVSISFSLALMCAGMSYGASLTVIHPNPESITILSTLRWYTTLGGSFVGTLLLLHFLWKRIIRRRSH